MAPATIITQCRLCGEKFEESLYSSNNSFYLSRPTGTHPYEDACPWCEDCREVALDTMDRLLDEIPGLADAIALKIHA